MERIGDCNPLGKKLQLELLRGSPPRELYGSSSNVFNCSLSFIFNHIHTNRALVISPAVRLYAGIKELWNPGSKSREMDVVPEGLGTGRVRVIGSETLP